MARALLCEACNLIENCKEAQSYCAAMNELQSIYNEDKRILAQEYVDKYREWLSIFDAEISTEYEELANKVIDAIPELQFIRDMDIHVCYMRCYYSKPAKNGVITYGDCRLVKRGDKPLVPFDFIISIYPEAEYLTDNQLKVLLWHELKHIGLNDNTLAVAYRINPHEVEDFHSIIDRLGDRWNEEDVEIEDILEGGV